MRYLWITVMLYAASPACGQWVRHYEDAEAVIYFDPTTTERRANFVRVWTLEDLKQRGEIGEMSRRWLNEFDCERATARVLSFSGHSGQMANGETLASYDALAGGEFSVGREILADIFFAGIESVTQDEFQHRYRRAAYAFGEPFEAALLERRKYDQRHCEILAPRCRRKLDCAWARHVARATR